jgi:FkbM family methyltransferase
MEIFEEMFSKGAYTPPGPAAARIAELTRPLRVLDLGGNIGLFGVDALIRYPGAEITSYEADPTNVPVLQRCVDLNAGAWRVVQACAMARDGVARIDSGNFADSRVGDDGVEVRAIDVLPLFGDFDFVKMDIESSEWPILTDERWPSAMRDVALFVLEWHQHGAPQPDARSVAVAAVRAAGFEIDASPPGHDHGVIWGWR